MTASPAEIVRRVFGFASFRPLQEAAVEHVVGGGDALVLMPTGGGKSLCYQVPALCRAGTALVVSPLIALMDDQVASLRQLGVAAAALHSEVDPEEGGAALRALGAGRLDLVYMSPERLLMPATLERLSRVPIALIAIDEAHCVSAWGHEFRPEYRLLARLATVFPGVPRVALTATADARTRDDILQALDIGGARVFAASFHRENLHLAARPKEGETNELLRFLGPRGGQAGIVYCGSRAKTERMTQRLLDKGLPAVAFHAGLAPLEKRVGLQRFRAGEPLVVVATIAFGMGIDRPDVRFVVHLDMPDSPEAYYQQIGRAGRDGEAADTLLLYGGEDIARARWWLSQSSAPEAQQKVMKARLEAMIALAETADCRTRALLACFGETLDRPCGHCDNCRSPIGLVDGTVAAQKALSAVYRTGEMFGALHVVSVLRGETTPMVTKHGHERLSTFGIGRDQPAAYWRGVIRQLIARGALEIESGDYATLRMVPQAARGLLRGEEAFMLRQERPRPATARGAPTPAPATGADGELFEALKRWRTDEAKRQSVPPYVIFHDSTLREIAAAQPGEIESLGALRGVGASKLERYGAAVLAIVAAR